MFDILSLQIFPLSHKTNTQLIENARISGKTVKPLFHSELCKNQGCFVDVSVFLEIGDGKEKVFLWKEENVTSFQDSEVDYSSFEIERKIKILKGGGDSIGGEEVCIDGDCKEKGEGEEIEGGESLSSQIANYGIFLTAYKRGLAIIGSDTQPQSIKSSVDIKLNDDNTFWKEVLLEPPSITTKSTNLKRKLPKVTTKLVIHSPLQSIETSSTINLFKISEYIKPKSMRYLIQDIGFVLNYFKAMCFDKVGDIVSPSPWNADKTQTSEDLQIPYFKPSLSIKLVSDNNLYPYELAGGLNVKKMESGDFVYLPTIFFDELAITSDSYIPFFLPSKEEDTSSTSESTKPYTLPLSISLDINLQPSRERLINHLSRTLSQQANLGFTETDIDDLRLMITDTSLPLLTATVVASTLHLLFEFLAFKSDVNFWKENTSLSGLSVRSLFLDFIGQIIILLFLKEEGSSMLVIGPAVVSVLIAGWKIHKALGLKLHRVKSFPFFGFCATRFKENSASDIESLELDKMAVDTLGSIIGPLVIIYALYSLFFTPQTGWYSWLITTLSTLVYALGFVLMTPQLFLNYKLKTVAHLPWRVLCLRFVNTFIDDLFAFVIRMPMLARIGCFRDDIVFFVFLYQRYIYEVDGSRPFEGGGSGDEEVKEETEYENKKSD